MENKNELSVFNADAVNKIKLILAESSPLMRLGFRKLIEQEKDMEIIAETGDGQEAVALAKKLKPGIVIVNLNLRVLNGLDTTREITEKCAGVKVILFDYEDSPPDIDISQTGASGYFTKLIPLELIIHYIRRISLGEKAYPYTMFRGILNDSLDTRALVRTKSEDITSKELSILKYIAQGLSNKDIAAHLGMTVPAVKACLANIFIKIGASSRTKAISISLKSGILKLSDFEQ